MTSEVLSEIKDILTDDERPLLIISFLKGFTLYLRFNDFDEYSYQINFSQKINDRIRFDNYDDRWPVSTHPHHLHPQNEKNAIESQMIGDPTHDIPILVKIIRKYT